MRHDYREYTDGLMYIMVIIHMIIMGICVIIVGIEQK